MIVSTRQQGVDNHCRVITTVEIIIRKIPTDLLSLLVGSNFYLLVHKLSLSLNSSQLVFKVSQHYGILIDNTITITISKVQERLWHLGVFPNLEQLSIHLHLKTMNSNIFLVSEFDTSLD